MDEFVKAEDKRQLNEILSSTNTAKQFESYKTDRIGEVAVK